MGTFRGKGLEAVAPIVALLRADDLINVGFESSA